MNGKAHLACSNFWGWAAGRGTEARAEQGRRWRRRRGAGAGGQARCGALFGGVTCCWRRSPRAPWPPQPLRSSSSSCEADWLACCTPEGGGRRRGRGAGKSDLRGPPPPPPQHPPMRRPSGQRAVPRRLPPLLPAAWAAPPGTTRGSGCAWAGAIPCGHCASLHKALPRPCGGTAALSQSQSWPGSMRPPSRDCMVACQLAMRISYTEGSRRTHAVQGDRVGGRSRAAPPCSRALHRSQLGSCQLDALAPHLRGKTAAARIAKHGRARERPAEAAESRQRAQAPMTHSLRAGRPGSSPGARTRHRLPLGSAPCTQS